ncbi:MAG: glycosyltransferase family 2 protein [Thermodesulfobacteriota bacterium]
MYLVSIITPSFNQGPYIEETIRSVLSQDYPRIEYRVVDGGSTDNTLQILERYKDRLTFVSAKDRGQTDALAAGFRSAAGDIFYWLNSDDTLLPGAVSRVMEMFNARPETGLVYGQSHFVDSAGRIIGRYPAEPFDHKRLAMFDFIPQPSAFFQRRAFEAVNGLDQRLIYGMDYDLWIRLTARFSACFLPQYLSTYRLHPSSKTVDMGQALANSREIMEIAHRHYGWAPANRVYGYCSLWLGNRFKPFSRLPKMFSIPVTAVIAAIQYLRMNKTIHAADLRQINREYIRKMGVGWNELYRTY